MRSRVLSTVLRHAGWIAIPVCVLCASTVHAANGAADPDAQLPHRMMMLVVQLGVIVLAARAGNRFATFLRMPGGVGELLAGVLIGPFILGAVPLPGFPDGLFHVSNSVQVGNIPVSPELYGICALASIVLLFMVGLETDLRLFMRYSLAGTLAGIGGVTVSFLCGDLLCVLYSPRLLGEQAGFFDAPCLFLGIIATATSVGVTARLLSERRQLDSPEGVTILAGAVIDDVLGLILLAVAMGMITASEKTGAVDWAYIGVIALKALGIWLVVAAIGLPASRRIGRLLKQFHDPSVIAIMALAFALILAGLFEQTGLAMIIGAYVMGLSLSRTDLNQVIRERLYPTYVLLVPVFFTVMGMLVDIRLLASPNVLGFGLLYTLVATLAKMGGCGLPATWAHFNLLGGARIGAGMLPRGEVALIIAGAGLAAGVFKSDLFGVVVLMTFCSALVAPPLVVALFRNPASGLRHPEQKTVAEPLRFHFPSSRAAELVVSKLLRAFEQEGFFVHTLSHGEKLYQLRNEEVVIGFEHRGPDVVFNCDEADTAFVNTAMLEVVAELEHTVRELRKPLDLDTLARRVQPGAGRRPGGLALRPFIHTELLLPRLEGDAKPAIIDELLGRLHHRGRVDDLDAARAAVLDREASMSTGMQYGIAIPHGRTDAVRHLVCTIGLKPEGVDFDSMDGRPSRIFVLALSPASAHAPHMQFMSTISQMLDEQGRAALLACDTAEEMHAVLTGEGLTAVDGARAPGLLARLTGARNPSPQLAAYLRSDLLTPHLTGETKDEVVDELLALIAHSGALRDLDQARAAIMAREQQMSTGMEHGVAIPHARIDAVDELVCAVGIKRQGIDYGSLDGERSTIFVLTLTPATAAAPHVQFMALITRALNESGRARALVATTRDELLNALLAR